MCNLTFFFQGYSSLITSILFNLTSTSTSNVSSFYFIFGFTAKSKQTQKYDRYKDGGARGKLERHPHPPTTGAAGGAGYLKGGSAIVATMSWLSATLLIATCWIYVHTQGKNSCFLYINCYGLVSS